jgi:hypothetical protein
MALIHQVIELRSELSDWMILVDITDDSTGIVYNRRYNWDHNPAQAEIDAAIVIMKTRITLILEYEANAMNLSIDENRAIDYLRNIKQDMILRIRAFPGVTQLQTKNYIEANYPDSIINFDRIYDFYLQLLGLTTWDGFKTWIIGHKFEGIDD